MPFLLIIVYLSLYYIRPSEWVPGLLGSPLLLAVGGAALIFLGIGGITRRFPLMIQGATERLMFGFVAAIALSHFSHLYVGGAIKSLALFLPSVTGFFLIVCIVDSRKRLSNLVLLLILLTTILAYEGWQQHVTGFSIGGLEPIFENKLSIDGEQFKIARIRWYGVFNDPNDLGLALTLAIPFLLDMLLRRRFVVPLVSLPLIFVAIYYTNSRGTVLAGLVAVSSYFIIRYRSLYGVAAGALLTGMLLFVGPSRMASVSASEESAYGRIEAWYQAYQMFKSNPFFGVGMGRFTEFNDLTAHNSFVLVMAELGFVGLFFFTGVFYLPYQWLWKSLFRPTSLTYSEDDLGLISAAFASLTGMLFAMFFLSRSYILIPFMLVAYVVAVTRVVGNDGSLSIVLPTDKLPHLRAILLLTLMQVVGINIIVKICL